MTLPTPWVTKMDQVFYANVYCIYCQRNEVQLVHGGAGFLSFRCPTTHQDNVHEYVELWQDLRNWCDEFKQEQLG